MSEINKTIRSTPDLPEKIPRAPLYKLAYQSYFENRSPEEMDQNQREIEEAYRETSARILAWAKVKLVDELLADSENREYLASLYDYENIPIFIKVGTVSAMSVRTLPPSYDDVDYDTNREYRLFGYAVTQGDYEEFYAYLESQLDKPDLIGNERLIKLSEAGDSKAKLELLIESGRRELFNSLFGMDNQTVQKLLELGRENEALIEDFFELFFGADALKAARISKMTKKYSVTSSKGEEIRQLLRKVRFYLENERDFVEAFFAGRIKIYRRYFDDLPTWARKAIDETSEEEVLNSIKKFEARWTGAIGKFAEDGYPVLKLNRHDQDYGTLKQDNSKSIKETDDGVAVMRRISLYKKDGEESEIAIELTAENLRPSFVYTYPVTEYDFCVCNGGGCWDCNYEHP